MKNIETDSLVTTPGYKIITLLYDLFSFTGTLMTALSIIITISKPNVANPPVLECQAWATLLHADPGHWFGLGGSAKR